MSKKCCRFFGGLLDTREKWLNKMSAWVIVLSAREKCCMSLKEAGQMSFSTVSTS